MKNKGGKRILRHLLSLLICFLLVCGIDAASFAEEGPVGEEDTAQTGQVDEPNENRDAPARAVVAVIGEAEYASLQDAVRDVPSGGTIKMVSASSEGTIRFKGGAFTLDLNGQSLSIAGFSLEGAMDLTLTGGGTLTLTASGKKSGIVPDPDIAQTVTLTINGASISSSGLLLYSEGSGSSVSILGGRVDCAGAMDGTVGCGAISGGGVTGVTISGGSFLVGQGQAIRAPGATVSTNLTKE